MPENLSRAVVLAAQAGDQESLTEVVGGMGRIVGALASRMAIGTHHDIEELHQAGMLGVLEALQSYDPARGHFETWCWGPMRHEIGKAMANNTAGPTIPHDSRWQYQKLMAAAGHNVSEALAQAHSVNMTTATFMAIHSALYGVTSPESFRMGPGEGLYEIEDTDNMEDGVAVRLLAESFLELLDDPLDVEMIRYSFGLDGGPGLTDQEIADRVGVSRRTVIRRRQAALDTMKAGHSEEEE